MGGRTTANVSTTHSSADAPVAQVARQAFSLWLGHVTRLQAEAARFVSDPMAKDLEVARQVAACETPAGLVEVQFALVNEMMDDYFEETRRLLDMAGAGFEDAAAAVT